jgi:universal stress protein E
MSCFTNILVGVNLTHCRNLDVSELDADAWGAIKHAVWLAKLNSARLLFFAALPQSQETLHEQPNPVLAELVRQAVQQGIEARAKQTRGEGSEEIIRQVLQDKHDLVVVATRDRTGLRRLLFGNTALTLFRRCPCPVWVAKPGQSVQPLNVLVATDLKPAGQEALRLGVPLGQLLGGTTHVLHVVEYPLDALWGTAILDADTQNYHNRIRAAAEQLLREQLHSVGAQTLSSRVQVHLEEDTGLPDLAIQNYIEEQHIDLLVMGTIARGGIAGITIGNTAERLLPEVHCSVLAVKPPDFHSPVKLDTTEAA